MAFFAASTSAGPSGPFRAANTPPTFTKGRQYSASTRRSATARAVARSNCSRSSPRAASSARAWRAVFSCPRRRLSSPRKTIRLPSPSSRVSRRSSRTILAGTDGNPAPVPTSITEAPSGSSTALSSIRLSRKCFTSMPSGSVMAVRFTFSLYSTRNCAYWSNCSSCRAVSSKPSAAAAALKRAVSIMPAASPAVPDR